MHSTNYYRLALGMTRTSLVRRERWIFTHFEAWPTSPLQSFLNAIMLLKRLACHTALRICQAQKNDSDN